MDGGGGEPSEGAEELSMAGEDSGTGGIHPTGLVTGASIHAPIQRNSMYIQTVRLYIYETR